VTGIYFFDVFLLPLAPVSQLQLWQQQQQLPLLYVGEKNVVDEDVRPQTCTARCQTL
jgi:hypothetical protein